MTLQQKTSHDCYLVSKSASDFVADKLKPFGDDSTRFFKHVLISGVFRPRDERWVRVSRKIRQEELPGASLKNLGTLIDAGLLQAEGSLHANMYGDRWRVPQPVYNEFVSTLATPDHGQGIDLDGDRLPDLFENQKSDRVYRSNKYDANRNPHPPLVQEAMEVLSRGCFQAQNILGHLESQLRQREVLLDMLGDMDISVGEWGKKAEVLREEKRRLFDLFSRDYTCFHTLRHQSLSQREGVYTYKLGYRPEPSGRLRQIGGGLQQCSAGMKKAAYAGIGGVHVYHIKASIPTMLRDFMAETGWDSPFLDTYLEASDPASTHAHEVGITDSEWTSLLDAVCLGAFAPPPENGGVMRSPPPGSLCSRFRRILRCRYGKLTQGQTYDEYARFYRQVSTFLTQLGKWRTHMTTQWLPDHAYVGRGGYWLRNDVGCSIKVATHRATSNSSGGLLPFWILRFLLRGREAHFIHTLTTEADKAGVEVISNEGDGIVTRGQIPDQALQSAKAKSPLDDVEVTEQSLG